MRKNGFTLLEFMILFAIIGIIGAVVAPLFQKTSTQHTNVPLNSRATGGLSCIGGFLFSTDTKGETRLATDAEHKAVKC